MRVCVCACVCVCIVGGDTWWRVCQIHTMLEDPETGLADQLGATLRLLVCTCVRHGLHFTFFFLVSARQLDTNSMDDDPSKDAFLAMFYQVRHCDFIVPSCRCEFRPCVRAR